jgi:hypothetical protein
MDRMSISKTVDKLDPELEDDAPLLRATIRGKIMQRKQFALSTVGKLFVDPELYSQVVNSRCAQLREHIRWLSANQLLKFQHLFRVYSLAHPHSFPGLEDLKALAKRELASRN